jgi:hypothetical protein
MNFDRIFEDKSGIVRWLKQASADENYVSILLWPIEQAGKPEDPPKLEAYFAQPSFSVFGLKGDWWNIEKELFEEIMTEEEYERMLEFEKRSLRSPESPNNKKELVAEIFSTNIRGVSVQVLHYEEWWQAFGGAHIGDNKRIIIVNAKPLTLKNHQAF